MVLKSEYTINKPLSEVWAKFDDADNLKEWMPGLISIDHVSGEHRTVGAKYKMVFENKGKQFEMDETLMVYEKEKEIAFRFDMKGVENNVHHYFEADGDKTVWRTDNDFKFGGFMKFLAPLMKPMMNKQNDEIAQSFIKFAEKD